MQDNVLRGICLQACVLRVSGTSAARKSEGERALRGHGMVLARDLYSWGMVLVMGGEWTT